MKATAFVAAPDDGPGATLKDIARQLRFKAVHVFRDIAAAEKLTFSTPLVYFLFGAVSDFERIRPTTQSIRTSSTHRIRFAPMVYFCENPSVETIRRCINMGFDDVVTLPFTLRRIEDRLGRQVGRSLVYYETPTYFGPDRRGRLENEGSHSMRGKGGPHRRIEIVRSPSAGINVVADAAQVAV